MSHLARRLATVVGGAGFLGGTVVVAMGISTPGTLDWPLLLGLDVPSWTSVASFVGGPLLLLGGLVFGMRYGNFERFHGDYDPETGRIDSDRAIAAIHERISADRLEPDEPPERFVLTRAHLGATLAIPTLPLLGYLYAAGLDGAFLWATAATLVVGALLAFLVTDYVLRNGDAYEYAA